MLFSSARATPWRRAGRRLEVSSGRLPIRAWPELTRSRTPLPGPRGRHWPTKCAWVAASTSQFLSSLTL